MDKSSKTQTRHFKKSLLDENYNFEENYFNKPLTEKEWSEIRKFLEKYFSTGNNNIQEVTKYFGQFNNLRKGKQNIENLRKIVDEVAQKNQSSSNLFPSYQTLNSFIIEELYTVKPYVRKVFFFPNEDNEDKVVNMLRTCKKSLYICIFTLTNDKVFAAVEEVWNYGCDVRIITDDECCKQLGSDIYKLASVGIPVKTDSSPNSHMHNKFAIIDDEVVMTGSFNWTTQAVKSNQENVVFIQDEDLAKIYSEEFENLWSSFTIAICQEEACKKVKEEQANRKKNY